MTKTCDNKSVGVLISDEAGRHLLFRRATPPVGIAPPAGHIDDHGSSQQAAIDEVAEEVGLTVLALELVDSAWRDNVCRRQHGPAGIGHQWDIYQATVTGSVAAGPREAADPQWYTNAELQDLTNRTIDYCRGLVTADEFAASPGIEPVWVRFLAAAGLVTFDRGDRVLLDAVANRLP